MISYKELSNIIKESNMTLINRYSSAYVFNKLSNLNYEDLVNNRRISVDKINNKNVGEDSYTIKVNENNKEHLFIPVLQPVKYNYNPFSVSKILSFQNVFPIVYTKNNNDIKIRKKCDTINLELEFDKEYKVIDFDNDRIEVYDNSNIMMEEYQIFKNSFYSYNKKDNKIEINKLNGKSIVYKNIKIDKSGEIFLNTLPSTVIDIDGEVQHKYNIKYYNSGMVKDIKNDKGESLCISDCGKDSGYSFYNLLFDPFNIWNNARNNLYSLWSLSWFVNTKRNTMLYSNDIYLIKLTDLDKIMSFIKNYKVT